ncbi:hypothetical protein [Streptomyces sp. MP131-18]|uniref:hypothetical protein n=1 Tax=Streptomyces sp. MP131-18 TaxID=1857892 RepID=UPI00097BACFC|nr:hypothetical protein [Streptomyces sp. MP131-18]ONK10363.1 hypothetical protein STBA_10850 [Streptomyces sp. MP131-18]
MTEPKLSMKVGPKAVTFVVSDEHEQTSIPVERDAPQEVIVQRLQRVLARMNAAPLWPSEEDLAHAMGLKPSPRPSSKASTRSGWAAVVGDTKPELPSRLRGDYEEIPPEESA